MYDQADESQRRKQYHGAYHDQSVPSTSRRSPFVTFQEPIHSSRPQSSERFTNQAARSPPFSNDINVLTEPYDESGASTQPSSFHYSRAVAQQPSLGRSSLRSSRYPVHPSSTPSRSSSLSLPPPPPRQSTFALPRRPENPNAITLALESIYDPPAGTSTATAWEGDGTSSSEDTQSRLDRVRFS